MATQIASINDKSVIITLKSGGQKKYKAPKTWGEFQEILGWIHSADDCKRICDYYRTALTTEQYASLRSAMFPTKKDRHIQAKKTKAAQRRIEKTAASVDRLQAWYVSQPGFMGNGYTMQDVQDSVPQEIVKSVYGL